MDDEILAAIKLLKDDNLVWSSDMDSIRTHLAELLTKCMQTEYYVLEPEIGDLVLKLIRDTPERIDDARGNEATNQADAMQSERCNELTGCKRQRDTVCCCARH